MVRVKAQFIAAPKRKLYAFEHFYENMPADIKEMLLPEARTDVKEFASAADFILFGYKWGKLPKTQQFWFDLHDTIHLKVKK